MTRQLSIPEIGVLVGLACKARENAYAPYSGFRVGAVVVSTDDRVFAGCNVENASYGLSLCAERSAMAAAAVAGVTRLRACLIVSDGPTPCTPCGACRQWLSEFGDGDLQVISATPSGAIKRFLLRELLPDPFGLPASPSTGPSPVPKAREG